jgi:hypothetical protein
MLNASVGERERKEEKETKKGKKNAVNSGHLVP